MNTSTDSAAHPVPVPRLCSRPETLPALNACRTGFVILQWCYSFRQTSICANSERWENGQRPA